MLQSSPHGAVLVAELGGDRLQLVGSPVEPACEGWRVRPGREESRVVGCPGLNERSVAETRRPASLSVFRKC